MDKTRADACPLCGNEITGAYGAFQQDDIGAVTYGICLRCGLIFQYPERYVIDYESEYRVMTEARSSREAEYATELMRALQIADAITMPFRSYLDVGAANGLLAGTIKLRHPNCEVWAVEPNRETAAKAMLVKGINVVHGLDELPGGSYDLVTLIHVLEHVPAPVEFMGRICALTDRVFIEVPYAFGKTKGASIFHPTMWGWGPLARLMGMFGFGAVPGSKLIHGWPLNQRPDDNLQAMFVKE